MHHYLRCPFTQIPKETGKNYMWSRCGEDDQTGQSSIDASVLDAVHDTYSSARKCISIRDIPSDLSFTPGPQGGITPLQVHKL